MSSTTSGKGRSGGHGSRSSQPATIPAVDQASERAVLGALLLYGDPRRVDDQVRKGLQADCFYYDYHRDVFAAMESLAARRDGVDELTVYNEMERLGTSHGIETKALLDTLAGYVPSAGNVGAYTLRVVEYAQWRKRGTLTHEMINAIQGKDEEAWQRLAQSLAPDADNNVIVLRQIMNADGELIRNEERECPNCADHKDEIKGLNRDLTTWRLRHANLMRDKEAEAREDGMWQLAQRLFEVWKALTGHNRSEFMWDRFNMVAPYLRNKKYGPRLVAMGIVGIAYDPYTPIRKNGTKSRQDRWDQLFKNTDRFEEYCNCAPKDWEKRIPEGARPYLLGPTEEPVKSQQSLSVV